MSSENLAIGFRPDISGSTESTAAGRSTPDGQFAARSFSSGMSTGIMNHYSSIHLTKE